jgi:hypothetical protein
MKKILLFLFILALTLINIKSYFHSGFPYTHDGENHLARFANYKISLKEGQIPPRLAPNLLNHYGYPVFNYNYPLANILSLPFSLVKINYETTFKIIAISFVFLGFACIYLWTLYLTKSTTAAIWSTAFFSTSPFLISTLVYRGNIGEIMALGLLPAVLWLIELINQQQIKIGGWNWIMGTFFVTAFALCHNISFVFGLPLLLLYAWLRFSFNRIKWMVLFSILAVAGLLSAWFWLPAIFEQTEIVVGSASLSKTFFEHFPTLNQLLFSPLQFGFSFAGPIDTLTFNLGSIQLVVLLLATLSSFKAIVTRSWRQISKWWLCFILASWLLIFLQLAISQPIWSSLSILRFIQFPWRLSLFLMLTMAGFTGYFITFLSKKVKLFLVLILLAQIHSFWNIKPVDYFHRSNETYEAFGQSTSTANENLPKTWNYLDIGDWQPGPRVWQGNAAIKVNYWKGSDREYSLLVNEPSIIIEPTMNFLGWQTEAIQNTDTKNMTYINSDQILGRIAYEIEPGEYQIRTKFTQKTLPRMIGNTLFIVALVLMLTLYIGKRYSKFEFLKLNDEAV